MVALMIPVYIIEEYANLVVGANRSGDWSRATGKLLEIIQDLDLEIDGLQERVAALER
jgi:hypothetical protein